MKFFMIIFRLQLVTQDQRWRDATRTVMGFRWSLWTSGSRTEEVSLEWAAALKQTLGNETKSSGRILQM
jgi:hypothetical protein